MRPEPPNDGGDTSEDTYDLYETMGFTVRTDRYRYTEWVQFDFQLHLPDWEQGRGLAESHFLRRFVGSLWELVILWEGYFMGRLFYGKVILWKSYFMRKLFYGKVILWESDFMGKLPSQLQKYS